MADKTLNQLTEIAALADDDLLLARDISAAEDFKITLANLKETSGINQRVTYVGSVGDLESKSYKPGVSVYLTEEGRHGPGIIKSGTPPSDPKKGIYIPIANGNYWVRQHGQAVTTGVTIKPEWFGLIKDDETVSVAEENHAVLRECIRFSFKHYIPEGVVEYAPTEIELPSGKIFTKGNSPLCLNRTEMEALGGNRYLRGLSWRGKGRKATRLILMNDGVSTWMYDTRDASFPGDTSVQDYTQFSHIGFESYDYYKDGRKFPVVDAEKINGFYMETYGWEKRFTWEGCAFEGFDTLYRWEGFGNGDLNTWTGCIATGIIDTVFYCNNNQSVANRLFGFDVSTYGDVFFVDENGGGDFLWVGGSVIQYPTHGTDNLPDNAAAAATPRGFWHVNLRSISSGATAGIPTSYFKFDKLRFENYDDFNYAVFVERANEVAYGSPIARFHDCTFDIDRFLPDDGSPSTAPDDRRNLTYMARQQADVLFDNCTLLKRHYFRALGYTEAGQNTSSIRLENCLLSDYEETDVLADRVDARNADSSLCLVSFDARNTRLKRPFFSSSVKRRAAHDFSMKNSMVAGPVVEELHAHIKEKDVSWPDGVTSENRLYLPPSAMVTSVLVKKNAVADLGGNTNYRLRIYADDGSTVVWQTADFKEEESLYQLYFLADPYIVPPAPDNHIRLAGLNGTVDKGNGGSVIVGYFTS